MKVLFSLLVLCFVAAIHAAPRVIGGRDAPKGKYPYQISLRGPRGHLCGGSILNKRWILTAAHCLRGKEVESLSVHVGIIKLNEKSDVYQADYIVAHPKFTMSKLTHDIGLVHVSKDIVFNELVKPIALPKEDFTKVNYSAVLTGWGTTKFQGSVPNNLQEIDLKIIDSESCDAVWHSQYPITNSHICTLTKRGEGACHGDSGGPLVSDGIQVGVVSFGWPCAIGWPDVFTRVYTFLGWIDEQIAIYKSNHLLVSPILTNPDWPTENL